MSGGSGAQTVRLDALTGLRWWAAFAVFLAHMRNFAPIPGTFEILEFGNHGVMFFFVLSGFVLTWSATGSVPVSTFYVRRFARIWPAASVALLFAVPIFYSLNPDPAQTWVKPFDLGILLLSLPLLQGWSRDPVVLYSGNPAAWTLTIEFFFYMLHPFIYRALRGLTRRDALIAVAGLVILSFGFKGLSLSPSWLFLNQLPLPILRLNEFVLGMLVAHAMRLGWRTRVPLIAVLVTLGGLVMLARAGAKGRLDPVLAGFVSDTTNEWLLVIFTLMIVSTASAELRGSRSLFARRSMVRLGEWSFAFYLVHATLIYAARDLFGIRAGWGNLLWYLPLIPLSIGLAAALHYCVERPCERRIRHGWDDRQDRIGARWQGAGERS